MEENKITWDTVCERAQSAVDYYIHNIPSQYDGFWNRDEIDFAQFELGSALCMVIGSGRTHPTYYDLFRVLRERSPHSLNTLKLAVSMFLDENGKYLMKNVPLPLQIKAYEEMEEFLTKNI
jgi:hypothetical protein